MKRQLRSEWLKARSTRGWLCTCLGAVLLTVFTALGELAAANKAGGVDLTTTTGVGAVLNAAFTATLMASIFGVVLVTNEHRYRTVLSTFVSTPRRVDVLLSKAIVSLVVGLSIGLVAISTAVAVTLVVGRSKGAAIDLGSGHIVLLLAGVVLACGLTGPWGVAIGTLVRHQTAAVILLIVYTTMAEAAIVQFVPNIGRFLPGGTIAGLTRDVTVVHPSMAFHATMSSSSGGRPQSS